MLLQHSAAVIPENRLALPAASLQGLESQQKLARTVAQGEDPCVR